MGIEHQEIVISSPLCEFGHGTGEAALASRPGLRSGTKLVRALRARPRSRLRALCPDGCGPGDLEALGGGALHLGIQVLMSHVAPSGTPENGSVQSFLAKECHTGSDGDNKPA